MKINIEGSCPPTTEMAVVNYGALFESGGCYYLRIEGFKGADIVSGNVVKFLPETRVIVYPSASVSLGHAP